MNITNTLPKDNGNWKLTIGTGEHLTMFEKKSFLYPVSVKGNIKSISRFSIFYWLNYIKLWKSLFNIVSSNYHSVSTTEDHVTYHHNPEKGTRLVMSWLTSNMTFCKVETPFAQDFDLQISIPQDPLHKDKLR